MDRLRFAALDTDDLEVVSAHLQDASVNPSEILWRPLEHRVVIGLDRIDWEAPPDPGSALRRRRAALRFDRVRACKARGFAPDKAAPLNLLAVEYSESAGASGIVTLIFSGQATFRLEVECLEAELTDLAPPPGHP